MKGTFALVFLLQVAVLFSASASGIIGQNTEPFEDVEEVDVEGGHTLIVIDGMETLLIDSSGSFVSSEEEIEDILMADIYAKADFEERKESIRNSIIAFNESRNPEEAECMRLTGVDTHECIDDQTCQVACRSVPNCMGIIFADGFIDSMMEWVGQKDVLDEKVLEALSGIENIESGPSTVQQEISSIEEMRDAAVEINEQNGLFITQTKECETCFEYCVKMNLSVDEVDEALDNLEALKTGLSGLPTVSERAAALKEAQDERVEYIGNRVERYEEMKENSVDEKNSLGARINGLSANVVEPSLEEDLAELRNMTGRMELYGVQGNYQLALALGDEFGQKARALDNKLILLEGDYDELEEKLKAIEQKIENSEELLNGTAEYEEIKGEVEGIDEETDEPLTPEEVSGLNAELDKLNGRLNEHIAEASVGTSMQQEQNQSEGEIGGIDVGQLKESCPVSVFIAGILLLAFVRGE